MKVKINYTTGKRNGHYYHSQDVRDEGGVKMRFPSGVSPLLTPEIDSMRRYHESRMDENNRIIKMQSTIEVEL